jgi:hypothetical protein
MFENNYEKTYSEFIEKINLFKNENIEKIFKNDKKILKINDFFDIFAKKLIFFDNLNINNTNLRIKLNTKNILNLDFKTVNLSSFLYKLGRLTQQIRECEKLENGYRFKGYLAANCNLPAVNFNLAYLIENGVLKIEFEYEIADCIKNLPRIGFEFGIDKSFADFSYIGFGPYESYVDKNMACEYGFYKANASTNYDNGYIRPQESGSHYYSRYLKVDNVFTVTADNPFSFSVNPYTTKQLCETLHNYELKKNDFVNVCLDLHMRGIGSFSCGPELDEKYEIPKKGKNVFIFKF